MISLILLAVLLLLGWGMVVLISKDYVSTQNSAAKDKLVEVTVRGFLLGSISLGVICLLIEVVFK